VPVPGGPGSARSRSPDHDRIGAGSGTGRARRWGVPGSWTRPCGRAGAHARQDGLERLRLVVTRIAHAAPTNSAIEATSVPDRAAAGRGASLSCITLLRKSSRLQLMNQKQQRIGNHQLEAIRLLTNHEMDSSVPVRGRAGRPTYPAAPPPTRCARRAGPAHRRALHDRGNERSRHRRLHPSPLWHRRPRRHPVLRRRDRAHPWAPHADTRAR
jgi:hypothetical protein